LRANDSRFNLNAFISPRIQVAVTVHLNSLTHPSSAAGWLGPALRWLEDMSGLALNASQKAVIAERAADALR